MLVLPNAPALARSDTGLISKYGAVLNIAVRTGDIVIVVCAAYVMLWLRFTSLDLPVSYASGLVRVALLTAVVFPAFGLYRSWRGERLRAELLRMWMAWTAVVGLFLLMEWAFKSTDEYSRLWIGGWFGSCVVLLSASRIVVRLALRSIRASGIDTRRIVLIGATESGARMVAATRQNPWMGLEVVGYVATPFDQSVPPDLPCLGGTDAFLTTLQETTPDQIWIALPMRAEGVMREILDATDGVPVTVRLVPDMFGYELINHHTASMGGVPVITLRGSRVEGYAGVIKAIEDRLIALVILTLISPLMLMLALGVKLSSPGPVFYRQKRHGLGAREIDVWKFRSMHVHHEQAGKVTQASRDDPRVTPFGRFLRASSLDELPQFINVLQGRMSIVGPRPHALAHNYEFSTQLRGYMQRHGVKPGITGLAQISGLRGETDTLDKMRKRVERDIEYIQHWSLWLDLKIIVLTPLTVLRRTNAH